MKVNYVEIDFEKCIIYAKDKKYRFRKEDTKLLKFNIVDAECFLDGNNYIYVIALEKAIEDVLVKEVE